MIVFVMCRRLRRWLPCRLAWLAPLAALQPEAPLQLRFMSNGLTTDWNHIAERETQSDYIRRALTKVNVPSTG